MGTAGTGIFHDDLACDVRDQTIELLREGKTGGDVADLLAGQHEDTIRDEDEGPVFWLALAAALSKYGHLTDLVRDKALEIIRTGQGLERWQGAARSKRLKTLEAFRNTLLAPQLKVRRPRAAPFQPPPSLEIASPDGLARATACQISGLGSVGGVMTQVSVMMDAKGGQGGGGVFVAACCYNDVRLSWQSCNMLEISYPPDVIPSEQKPSIYYRGRTITVVCMPMTLD